MFISLRDHLRHKAAEGKPVPVAYVRDDWGRWMSAAPVAWNSPPAGLDEDAVQLWSFAHWPGHSIAPTYQEPKSD